MVTDTQPDSDAIWKKTLYAETIIEYLHPLVLLGDQNSTTSSFALEKKCEERLSLEPAVAVVPVVLTVLGLRRLQVPESATAGRGPGRISAAEVSKTTAQTATHASPPPKIPAI